MFRRFAISTINSAYYIGMYLYFIFSVLPLCRWTFSNTFRVTFVAIYTAILCILLKCEVVTLGNDSLKHENDGNHVQSSIWFTESRQNETNEVICAFNFSMLQAITLSRSYRRSLLWGLWVYTKYRFTWCVAVSHVWTDWRHYSLFCRSFELHVDWWNDLELKIGCYRWFAAWRVILCWVLVWSEFNIC